MSGVADRRLEERRAATTAMAAMSTSRLVPPGRVGDARSQDQLPSGPGEGEQDGLPRAGGGEAGGRRSLLEGSPNRIQVRRMSSSVVAAFAAMAASPRVSPRARAASRN